MPESEASAPTQAVIHRESDTLMIASSVGRRWHQSSFPSMRNSLWSKANATWMLVNIKFWCLQLENFFFRLHPRHVSWRPMLMHTTASDIMGKPSNMQPVINFDCLHLASIRFMFYFHALPLRSREKRNFNTELRSMKCFLIEKKENLARATVEPMLWFTCVFNGIAQSMHHRGEIAARVEKNENFHASLHFPHTFLLACECAVFTLFAINPSTHRSVCYTTLSAAIAQRTEKESAAPISDKMFH